MISKRDSKTVGIIEEKRHSVPFNINNSQGGKTELSEYKILARKDLPSFLCWIGFRKTP